MLDFRKVLLAAAVAGLGLVGTASAQITCNNSVTGTASLLAVEGTTEPLNPVTESCGAQTGNTVTLTLTSNVPFTNATTTSAPGYDITATASTGAFPPFTNIAASSITISGGVLTATFNLAGAALQGITFTGLRVNASAVPSTSIITITPGAVAGGGILIATPAANTLATVLVSQATPVVTPYVATGVAGYPQVSGASVSNLTVCGINTAYVYQDTAVTIAENFASSFKTAADYGAGGGTAYTQGTRFAITFNNLNASVNYYVPAVVTNGTLTFTAYSGPTGSTAATLNSAAIGKAGFAAGSFAVNTLAPLTVTNGSATVYYGVTAENIGALENVIIPLYQNIPTVSSVTATSTSAVTVSSQLVGVTTGYPQFVSTAATAISPTTALNVAPNQGLLSACSTTLLFPYVVNSSGFDTGVVISNASSTGVGSPAAAAGTCSVTFYGTGAPPTAYVTPILPAASNLTFSASTQAPGLNGYAVATCTFQGAHGYAFVFSGAGTPSAYAADYLAVVISTAGAAPTAVAF